MAMSDKELRSLDKTKLLDIMRQQELLIGELTAEKNELIKQLEERRGCVEKAAVKILNEARENSSAVITEKDLRDLTYLYKDFIENAHFYMSDMIEKYRLSELYETVGNPQSFQPIQSLNSLESSESIQSNDVNMSGNYE